jgi:hypothetical protein
MRNIELGMVKFLETALKGNGLYNEAVKNKDARTVFRLAAQACIGIREVGGNNRGPMVRLIQQTIGDANAEAWCMSFVQTCLAFAEVRCGAKSPIHPSEHCMTVWNKTAKSQRVKTLPLPGAIIIWQHGKGPAGHTGIVEGCDGKIFTAFEGNTESGLDPKGKVERDGGGVYHTKRNISGNGSMKVVGFLKPF